MQVLTVCRRCSFSVVSLSVGGGAVSRLAASRAAGRAVVVVQFIMLSAELLEERDVFHWRRRRRIECESARAVGSGTANA